MPSLNHVSMWSASEHKWVSITAEEAAKEFPFTVPATRGRLRCELCGHFVALTGPGANIRHFCHAAADENKECEERSLAYSIVPLYDKVTQMRTIFIKTSEYATLFRLMNVSND